MPEVKKPQIVWIAGALIVGYLLLGGSGGILPEKPAGPDLTAAFAQTSNTSQAAADARQFAALCASLADMMEYDGKRTEPRLLTGVQMDDLRRWAREYLQVGSSFGSRYPRLPELVGGYLDEKLGKSGGPVTPESRAAWVAAHRQLSLCGEYAAKAL